MVLSLSVPGRKQRRGRQRLASLVGAGIFLLGVSDAIPATRAWAAPSGEDAPTSGTHGATSSEDAAQAARATSASQFTTLSAPRWTDDPAWLPTAAAFGALVPGVGHLIAEDPSGAAITATAFFLPISVEAGWPPDRARSQVLEGISWGTYCYQLYGAHQVARIKTGNAGYPQPLVKRSLLELLVAPFDPRNMFDARIWLPLGVDVLVILGLIGLAKVDLSVDGGGGWVFDARTAHLGGQPISPALGYGLNVAASAAEFAAVGAFEEAAFRGVLQTELERPLGPVLGNIAASTVFAAYHQPGTAAEFLVLAVAGYSFGKVYQDTGYDLASAAAAHAYADIGIAAVAELWPRTVERPLDGYSNPLAIHFEF